MKGHGEKGLWPFSGHMGLAVLGRDCLWFPQSKAERLWVFWAGFRVQDGWAPDSFPLPHPVRGVTGLWRGRQGKAGQQEILELNSRLDLDWTPS